MSPWLSPNPIWKVPMFQIGLLIVIAYFVLMAIFASWAE